MRGRGTGGKGRSGARSPNRNPRRGADSCKLTLRSDFIHFILIRRSRRRRAGARRRRERGPTPRFPRGASHRRTGATGDGRCERLRRCSEGDPAGAGRVRQRGRVGTLPDRGPRRAASGRVRVGVRVGEDRAEARPGGGSLSARSLRSGPLRSLGPEKRGLSTLPRRRPDHAAGASSRARSAACASRSMGKRQTRATAAIFRTAGARA